MAAGGRASARVLAVDRRDRVLLLVVRAADGASGLLTPGGGIEPGEGVREAAARELREETGIDVDPADLQGPLHDGPTTWTDRHGREHTVHASFFAAAVDDPVVSFAGQTADELDFILDAEWVAPAAVAGDPRVRNPLLPLLAARAVSSVRAPARPVERVTARVLPVCPEGAVLLLQDQDPAVPGLLRWGSVGGAVDPGETLLDAAVRETFEETGLRVGPDELLGPVHVGVREYTYDGVGYVGRSTSYAVPTARDAEVSLAHLAPDELGHVVASRWWTPDDLAADGSAVDPALPDIMRAAIAAVGGER